MPMALLKKMNNAIKKYRWLSTEILKGLGKDYLRFKSEMNFCYMYIIQKNLIKIATSEKKRQFQKSVDQF